MHPLRSSLLGLATLAAWGCAHQAAAPARPEPAAIPVAAAAAAPAAAPTTPAATLRTCSIDADCGSGSLCLDRHCVAITADLALCRPARVSFDFDSALLHAEDRPALDDVARCLRAAQAMHVTIEGNADERGTEEYNLQLGQKRASEVERYLQTQGVSRPQLKTISYGVENPLCREHDEACWAKNRRSDVKPAEFRTPSNDTGR